MSQRRVVDMSKGFENVSNPIRYVQQNQPVQQQVPVQAPHVQQQYVPNQQQQEKAMLYRPPISFNVQTQKSVDNRSAKYIGSDISHFNLDGCKSMDEAYRKNENKIKIVPE